MAADRTADTVKAGRSEADTAQAGTEQDALDQASIDQASIDQASIDRATADRATADRATTDRATADRATPGRTDAPETSRPDQGEEAAGGPTEAAASAPPSERLPLRRSRTPVMAVLGTVLVAAVVTSIFLGRSVIQAGQEARERTEALQTARQLVVNFTTVDHRSFAKSTSGVLALSAGDFRQQYSNASKDLEKLVEQNETVSQGKVLDVGIVSFDKDSARVLVTADADVTNASTKKPQLRTYRLQLDLSREGSGWRVVELQFVG